MKDPAEKEREGNDKADPPTLSAISGMSDMLEDNTHLEVQPENSEGEEKAGEGESKVGDDNDYSQTGSAKSGAETPVDPALSNHLLDATIPGRETAKSDKNVEDSNDHSVADSTGTVGELNYSRKHRKTNENKNEDKAHENEHDDKSDDEKEATGSVAGTSYASSVSNMTNEAFVNLRSITYLHLARWSTRKPQYESVIEVLLDDNQNDLIPQPPALKSAAKSSTEQNVRDEKAPKTPKVEKNYGSLSPSWSKVKALQLMIHSPDLIANLKDIDLKVNWDNVTLNGRVVFIRPFKFLVLREAEIRERFRELETFLSHFAQPPPTPPLPPPGIPLPPPPPPPDELNEIAIPTNPSAPSSHSISPTPLYQPSSPLPFVARVVPSPRSTPPSNSPLLLPDSKEVENVSRLHEAKDESYDSKGIDEDLESSGRSEAKEEKQSTILEEPKMRLESPSDLGHHDVFDSERLRDPIGPRRTGAGSTKTNLPKVLDTLFDDDDDAEDKLAKLEKFILTQQNKEVEQQAEKMAAAEAAARLLEAAKKAREEAEAKATMEAEETKAAHERALAEARNAAEELEKAKKAAEEEAAKLRPNDAPKPPIKFKDAVGRKFSFPWHLCKTWKVSYY